MNRLSFLVAAAIVALFAASPACRAADAPPARPNILWLTTEDIGPQLGCYGDAYADTPNIDKFAARALRYRTCWSNAPVCAPARTTIITGVYATATGAEHMRSVVRTSADVKMYPQVLREAGYYCTNNVKEDYNLTKPGKVWDESSKNAHWRNRPAGQPFFAVFNNVVTHESQIRKRPHAAVHDPAKVKLPSYHPDTPEVRQDWAQYYDNITTMDGWFGKHLKDLADAGLADDTIVFFYGDHGSGMPRSKRSACNSGLDVALIVYVPEKWKHLAPPEYKPGAMTDRLVSFVDLAPTLFSLAGAKVPEWVQGQAFMGPAATKPREYVYGYRGRMDERMDRVRSVRDGRYVYVRNFMPHRPHGQYNDYMFQTPTTRVWKRLFDEGKLNAVQSQYWTAPKAAEELYDLQTDPDEVKNLAGSPEHAATLERLRGALRDWIKQTGDVGLMPEGIMHERAGDGAPYDLRKDPAKVPLDRIVDTAYLASGMEKGSTAKLADRLADPDAAVRYWAATGLLIRGQDVAKPMAAKLRALLADPSPHVRIPAAETLGRYGATDDVAAAVDALVPLADVKKHGYYVATAALIALDEMGPAAAPAKDKLLALPKSDPSVPGSMKDHIPRLLDHIGSTLGFTVKE